MASTSSSVTASPSPTQGWTYDVFLSFRGPDTRHTFIDYLYNSLEKKGIRTFKDDNRLEKGDCISDSLLNAIRGSKFFIPVFSEGYASSKWCLEELATVMECQEKLKEQIVVPIFYHVEPTDVRNQKGSFEVAFKELHKKTGKDDGEKVRRWKEALKKAGELKGHHLQNDYNRYEATCAEHVAADIDARLYRASLAFEENLVGLESRVNNIGDWLRLASDDNDDVRFIGICGMGGIGKTTIATAVFNRFSLYFDGACFLADVRQHNDIELQKTLLTKILKDKSGVEISNVPNGIAQIKKRLKAKKVLIVLDDVDDGLEQLDKLAGGGNWFGRGSRVIITTRDARVLHSHGVDKKYVYEVHTLEHQNAIQLFSHYAFKSEIPAAGFEVLSGSVVHYCKGLPLALKILGYSLHGVEAADWESSIKQLKDTPNDNIYGKLKISFDRLDPKSQKIFLHITCFFRHEDVEYVKDVLKSCDLNPVGMRTLIEKYLISVREGRIEMHDLIQEMGWHIAKAEKPRSRVWEFKEDGSDGVLFRKMETKHIECILFPYSTYGFWLHNYENISSAAFEALKILIGNLSYKEEEANNFELDVKDNYQLPSSLRWLHFPSYPFRSLPPSFHPSSMDTNPAELVGLCLHRSSLENCWITKELNKLIYLDLSSSRSLLETPNFDMMPNLRKLDLSHCTTLKEIHPSVGRLKELVLLDVSHCFNLKKLPTFIQVSSLKFLKLRDCPLENFPEIQKSIPFVEDLNLQSVRIRELPQSIRQLCGLTKLRLFGCRNLVHLSDDLCELKNLKVLELTSCSKLESLPKNLGYLSKLEELYIFDTAIFQLPSSITQLSLLECLCWGHKHGFGERPLKFLCSVSALCSLKRLQLCDFKTIVEELPSDLGQCLISLEYLNLQGSNFGYLPESFSQLPHLQYLDIRDCEKLKKLPELPKTIKELYVDSHFAFGNKSSNIDMLAIKYPMLYSVSFSSRSDEYDSFRSETFLAKKSIQFQFQREAPFSVSYSSSPFYEDEDEDGDEDYTLLMRSFKYGRYKSNRIFFNLSPRWHSTQFVGFAIFFVSSQADICGPHAYQGLDDRTHHHCLIKAKLSSQNDSKNEDLEAKCVIAGSTYYRVTNSGTQISFVYLPFSWLWPESKPMMEANDYSRFEVELLDLEASANWGIDLLYKSPIRAREHMANYHWSDSGPDISKLLESTEIIDQVQCQMVSTSECSEAKVSRLLYTNSGVGILALSSDGIQKLWKCSYNEQNSSRKVTVNSVPQNWQPNSGLPMINDVSGVNLEEVVPCIALSNDDSYIVSAAGGKISLFNIMTSEVMKTITPLPSASTFLAFDPHNNNIIAIGTEESSIYIYDCVNEEFIKLREHRKPITGLAFSTKLKMLVSADADAQLCVWSTNLWKMRRSVRIQLPGGEVPSGGDTQVMFHVDQVHLLVTHETQLAVYDASKMELIHQCIPHVSPSLWISSATYSCNGQLIYASFIDGNIGVLDADTLTLKCRIDPSAYLPPQRVLNGSKDVYPLVIAAHPQEPNQFAVGLTDGSIEEIESDHNHIEQDCETTASHQELAAEKKTCERPAAMKIDEVEARLKEKDPTANSGAKKIRLKKGILIRSPKSSTIVPDFMVSKALEKAAAAAVTSTSTGLEEHTVLDSSCIEEDNADELFIIKSLRSACAITEKLLDKKLHLKNELSEERSRVTELEEKNRQLEARNKELAVELQDQKPTIDQLEKEKHELTLLLQTYQARATQAEAANSDLLLALKNLLNRYGTLEKQQQLEDKHKYKKFEKEQDEVKDECEGLKLENEILKKKLLQAEESGVSNWQQSPNFLNEENIIRHSGKQNKGKNEQNDGRGELLATNDVFQRLGNDCKQLYNLLRLTPNIPDYLDLELDANIFHHMNMERIFVMIEDIEDLFTMNWLDVSIIQVFIRYLYQLCKKSKVSSIGFMCPTQISKANVDMNLEAVIAYLHNTISELQDKTFILAPYHQVNHWLLLVICTSSRMVYVLDPMQCDRDLEIKPVLNMVFRTFTNQRGARARCSVDWKNIKCPCQPGNSECGYYVMRYMYDICTKYFASTLLDEAFQETKTYSDKEIDEIRNKWAQYFLNECV